MKLYNWQPEHVSCKPSYDLNFHPHILIYNNFDVWDENIIDIRICIANTHTHTHTLSHTEPISPYHLTIIELLTICCPTKFFMFHFEMTSIVIQKNQYFRPFSLDVIENYFTYYYSNLTINQAAKMIRSSRWKWQNPLITVLIYLLSHHTNQIKS